MRKLISVVLIVSLLAGCASTGGRTALEHPATSVACTALDVGTTIAVLNKGGVELNPLMAAVIESGGYPLLIAINVGLVWWMYHRAKKRAEVEMAEAKITPMYPIIRCGAAFWNFGQL